MCIFSKSSSSTATAPQTTRPTPIRRGDGNIATLFNRRRQGARGVFGNIFTSPLGVTKRAGTSATTLGSLTSLSGA